MLRATRTILLTGATRQSRFRHLNYSPGFHAVDVLTNGYILRHERMTFDALHVFGYAVPVQNEYRSVVP